MTFFILWWETSFHALIMKECFYVAAAAVMKMKWIRRSRRRLRGFAWSRTQKDRNERLWDGHVDATPDQLECFRAGKTKNISVDFRLISQAPLGYNVTGFNGWDYGLVVMQHNWQVLQAIELPLVWHLGCEVYFMRVLWFVKNPQKSLQWDFNMSWRVASSSASVVCL